MSSPKKKLIVSYSSLSPELLEAIRIKYPLGWINHTKKVPTSGDGFFYAITLDTEEISYLIKVPVKIDVKSAKEDEDFFGSNNDFKEEEPGDDEKEKEEGSRDEHDE